MREIPNFGELLGPFISAVPATAVPGFLARLERFAAERYREWAETYPGPGRDELLACAAREEEIADRAEVLFPLSPAELAKVESALPPAAEAYRAVFRDLPVREQLWIQAGAELQGAEAWRGIAAQHADASVRDALAECSALEEKSSAAVRDLLDRDGSAA